MATGTQTTGTRLTISRTAAIWTALLGGKLKDGARIEPEDVGLCMVGVKLSRQINRPKRDNLTDAAGYCETVRMVVDEKARREILALISDGSHRSTGSINGFPSIRELETLRSRETASRHGGAAKAPAAHERRRHG